MEYDTTSICQKSLCKQSNGKPSVSQLRQLVNYVNWSSSKYIRRFINLLPGIKLKLKLQIYPSN